MNFMFRLRGQLSFSLFSLSQILTDLRFALLPLVLEAREGHGSRPPWPLQREQGSPFPLHALGEEAKFLSPLECLVVGQGGGVTSVVIIKDLREDPAMDPGRARFSPRWLWSVTSLSQNLPWLSINYETQILQMALKAFCHEHLPSLPDLPLGISGIKANHSTIHTAAQVHHTIHPPCPSSSNACCLDCVPDPPSLCPFASCWILPALHSRCSKKTSQTELTSLPTFVFRQCGYHHVHQAMPGTYSPLFKPLMSNHMSTYNSSKGPLRMDLGGGEPISSVPLLQKIQRMDFRGWSEIRSKWALCPKFCFQFAIWNLGHVFFIESVIWTNPPSYLHPALLFLLRGTFNDRVLQVFFYSSIWRRCLSSGLPILSPEHPSLYLSLWLLQVSSLPLSLTRP